MLRIAIVGAGIAGLSSAILLARNGHEVDVFERRPSLEVVGGGLLLQPCGLDVLARLGLLVAAIERGSRIDRFIRRHRLGRITVALNYSEFRVGLHALGITRSALLELLMQAAASAGVRVATGVAIAKVENVASGVKFEDQSGHKYGEFDALIVSDGMRSRLREHLGVPISVSQCSLGVWSVCAPMPPPLDGRAVIQQFDRGIDVTGLLPSGPDSSKVAQVTWFQNVPLSGSRPSVAVGFDQWRRSALFVCPEAAPILQPLRTFDDLHLSLYEIVSMPRWYASRCVVIGDAAHALDPRIGMGANMALVDSAVLADSLAAVRVDRLPEAFRVFDGRRRSQVARYQNAARYLPAIFEQGGLASSASEVALRAALRVPAMRRAVIQAMSGYMA